MEIIQLFIISFALSHLSESISYLLPDNKYFIIPKFLTGCKKCSSFWISLIISGDLFTSSVIWLLMFLYDRFLEHKMNKIKI